MSFINKVTLMGNLGQAPELRSHTGTVSCVLSIATTEKNITTWHRVVLWGKLAEIADKYLSKGDKVYIEGYATYYKYKTKDGIQSQRMEVTANLLKFINIKNKPTDTVDETDTYNEDDMPC